MPDGRRADDWMVTHAGEIPESHDCMDQAMERARCLARGDHPSLLVIRAVNGRIEAESAR